MHGDGDGPWVNDFRLDRAAGPCGFLRGQIKCSSCKRTKPGGFSGLETSGTRVRRGKTTVAACIHLPNLRLRSTKRFHRTGDSFCLGLSDMEITYPGRTDHAIRNRYHRLQAIMQKQKILY